MSSLPYFQFWILSWKRFWNIFQTLGDKPRDGIQGRDGTDKEPRPETRFLKASPICGRARHCLTLWFQLVSFTKLLIWFSVIVSRNVLTDSSDIHSSNWEFILKIVLASKWSKPSLPKDPLNQKFPTLSMTTKWKRSQLEILFYFISFHFSSLPFFP